MSRRKITKSTFIAFLKLTDSFCMLEEDRSLSWVSFKHIPFLLRFSPVFKQLLLEYTVSMPIEPQS